MPDLFGNPHGYLIGQAELFERDEVVAPARREDEAPRLAHASEPKYPVFKLAPPPKAKDAATRRIEKQYNDFGATGKLL